MFSLTRSIFTNTLYIHFSFGKFDLKLNIKCLDYSEFDPSEENHSWKKISAVIRFPFIRTDFFFSYSFLFRLFNFFTQFYKWIAFLPFSENIVNWAYNGNVLEFHTKGGTQQPQTPWRGVFKFWSSFFFLDPFCYAFHISLVWMADAHLNFTAFSIRRLKKIKKKISDIKVHAGTYSSLITFPSWIYFTKPLGKTSLEALELIQMDRINFSFLLIYIFQRSYPI